MFVIPPLHASWGFSLPHDLQWEAFGNGASTVVGNMLGENDPKAAKMAAVLTVAKPWVAFLFFPSFFVRRGLAF